LGGGDTGIAAARWFGVGIILAPSSILSDGLSDQLCGSEGAFLLEKSLRSGGGTFIAACWICRSLIGKMVKQQRETGADARFSIF
jgi:hypothetical protein